MNEEVYGKDLAKYKLERAEEELEAALLLSKSIKTPWRILIKNMLTKASSQRK